MVTMPMMGVCSIRLVRGSSMAPPSQQGTLLGVVLISSIDPSFLPRTVSLWVRKGMVVIMLGKGVVVMLGKGVVVMLGKGVVVMLGKGVVVMLGLHLDKRVGL